MSQPASVSTARKVARVIIAIAVIVGGVIALRALKNSGLLERALQWLGELGPWAPLMFILIYIGSVVFLAPAVILTLGAGILFGLFHGAVYVMTGAIISAVFCFIIARYAARSWIARVLERHPKFRAIDDAVARDGWKIVALIRLAPIFPFSLTNYAFGLTRVPLWQYAVASLAMIPGTTIYVYFGTLIGDVTGIRRGPSTPAWMKWSIGIVAVFVAIYLARFARRALKQRVSQ